jgi:hypothetical protein
MAIVFGNTVVSLRHRIRRMFRMRQIHACYVTNLKASAGSLDNRVRFHIEHLDEYWDRWLGFLPVLQATDASYSSNDLVVCVLVATESASRDVHAYCSQYATQALRDAWDLYVSSLAEVRRGVLKGPEGVNLCAGMFHKGGNYTRSCLHKRQQTIRPTPHKASRFPSGIAVRATAMRHDRRTLLGATHPNPLPEGEGANSISR